MIFAVFNVFQSKARRATIFGRAHALQRVNVAPPCKIIIARNISYAYLYVYLDIQIYNEDKSWS